MHMYEPKIDEVVGDVAAATERILTAASTRGKEIAAHSASDVMNYVRWVIWSLLAAIWPPSLF